MVYKSRYKHILYIYRIIILYCFGFAFPILIHFVRCGAHLYLLPTGYCLIWHMCGKILLNCSKCVHYCCYSLSLALPLTLSVCFSLADSRFNSLTHSKILFDEVHTTQGVVSNKPLTGLLPSLRP